MQRTIAKSTRAYIKSKLTDDGKYYLLLDEVQQLGSFETVLNGYLYENNLDVYVTGSNSKFPSSDVLTEFRGRGDEVRGYPLSFSKFYFAKGGDKYDAGDEYHLYGGMPALFKRNTEEQKIEYLKTLMSKVYLSDIVERNHVQYPDEMDSIVDFCVPLSASSPTQKRFLIRSKVLRASRSAMSRQRTTLAISPTPFSSTARSATM